MQQEIQTQTKAHVFSFINAVSKGFELAILRKDCRYGVGPCLAGKKIVSNRQDMPVKEFIRVHTRQGN